MEGDGEAGLDSVNDLVGEGHQVGVGGGASAVDEGQGVAGADPDGAFGCGRVAFGEAGSLDEPGGGELEVAIRSGPVGDGFGGYSEGFGDVGEGGCGDDGVLEEGAGGAGVWREVGWVDQHAFGGADGADGGVDFERCGVRMGGEVVAEVGVG